MGFETELIPLTMRNPETGRRLTANVYTVEGVEGRLSMGQLVMVICLSRACEIEDALVDEMRDVDDNSDRLKTLTDIQEALVEWYSTHGRDSSLDSTFAAGLTFEYHGRTFTGSEWRTFLWEECGISEEDIPDKTVLSYDEVENAISALSDRMDSLNSISQDQLIKMQSLTAKRDQSYDMLTNILKSFNTQLVGLANNI